LFVAGVCLLAFAQAVLCHCFSLASGCAAWAGRVHPCGTNSVWGLHTVSTLYLN
jgi:hypothetical protein